MARKISLLFSFLLLFSLVSTFAQEEQAQEGEATESAYPGLKYQSKPKHMTEVGVHFGHAMLVGDVAMRPSFGFGLHVRRAFNYAFSWRLDLQYARPQGLEGRNSGTANGQATANNVLNSLGYGNGNAWYHNYRTTFYGASAQLVYSLNSLTYKQGLRKINFYVFGGPGIGYFEAFYDALDGSGSPYDFNRVADGLNPGTNRSDRNDVRSNVQDLLDGDYETRAELAQGRRSGSGDLDDIQINIHADLGAGVSFKISPRFNIALEHKVTAVFGNEGDLLDGYRWRTTEDLTQFRDLLNYTNIRLNFNLGKMEKASEPLYWVSPMDQLAEDLAEVKARPVFDPTDSDGDGVIDMVDAEKNTRKDCPVDTRGMILDSDGDGVVDCDDEEPYSPPGYQIDSKGVAQVPEPDFLNEKQVNEIIDTRLSDFRSTIPTPKPYDWFLPMVNFKFDSYCIGKTEYAKLHQVATVMRQNPTLRVVASGYTDGPASATYNDVLSYKRANEAVNYLVSKYGLDRSRFVINFGGENSNLVPTSARELMNRRVEFSVATTEADMARPAGPDAGKCLGGGSYGSTSSSGSGSGSGYSGNKEAGF